MNNKRRMYKIKRLYMKDNNMNKQIDYYGLFGWYLLEFENKKITRKECLKKIMEVFNSYKINEG